MQRLLFIWLMLLLAACTTEDGNGGFVSTATPEPFSAEVDLQYPPDGAVIYAETVTVSGTIEDETRYAFDVEIVDAEGNILAESSLDTSGDWSVEIVHGYTGEPAEFSVRVVPPTANTGTYDRISILMASNSFRPEGTFGNITAPGEDAPIGGESILVEGTISGVESFTVALVDPAGFKLAEQTADVINPQRINEIPWQVELSLGTYTGTAEIRLLNADDDPLSIIPIVIGTDAG